jgi:hypothetical protein
MNKWQRKGKGKSSTERWTLKARAKESEKAANEKLQRWSSTFQARNDANQDSLCHLTLIVLSVGETRNFVSGKG